MSKYVVRQASLGDLAVLAPLFDEYRQLHGQASDIKTVKAFLLARFHLGESALFIAQDGDRLVGFAHLYASFSSMSLKRTYLLSDIYVRPECRRQGIARRMVDRADEFARAAGAERMTLQHVVQERTLAAS